MEKGEWGGWFFFARCKHSHHHHPYSMQSSSCQGQCKPYPIHPITWQFVFYWILTHILNHWGSNEFWMKYINDQYLLCISSLILNVYHLSWMLSILAWIYHHSLSQVMGRTGMSWCKYLLSTNIIIWLRHLLSRCQFLCISVKITVFYIVYYTFLAGFFIMCLSVFLAVKHTCLSYHFSKLQVYMLVSLPVASNHFLLTPDISDNPLYLSF